MAVFLDDFNRPDTTEAQGLGEIPGSGLFWESVSGAWRILNGRPVTSTSHSLSPIVVVNTGSNDADIITDAGPGDAIYLRFLSVGNWLRARVRRYSSSSGYWEYQWRQDYQQADEHGTTSYSHSLTAWSMSSTTAPSFPAYLDHQHTSDTGTQAHRHATSGSPYVSTSRYVSTGTYTYWQVILEKSVGGTVTALGTANTSGVSRLRMRAVDSTVLVYVNGSTTPLLSVSSTDFPTATRHGDGRAPSEESATALDNVTLDTLNTAPNAPALLAPVGGTSVDRAGTTRFRWQPSDPDVGDYQTRYDLRYRTVGSTTWTEVTASISDPWRDIAGGTFAAGNWEWQARTYDRHGRPGPYSSSAFFTAADRPSDLSITSPINGSVIGEDTALVQWATGSQDAYEVRVLGPAGDDTVIWATGVVEGAGATTVRAITAPFPVNGVERRVQVLIRRSGLWSSPATSTVTVSYTPPAIPLIGAEGKTDIGAILVTVIYLAPTGTQPDVISHEIWRREVGETGDGGRYAVSLQAGGWIDWRVRPDVEYEYRARAIGSNGTASWTVWARGPLGDTGSDDEDEAVLGGAVLGGAVLT